MFRFSVFASNECGNAFLSSLSITELILSIHVWELAVLLILLLVGCKALACFCHWPSISGMNGNWRQETCGGGGTLRLLARSLTLHSWFLLIIINWQIFPQSGWMLQLDMPFNSLPKWPTFSGLAGTICLKIWDFFLLWNLYWFICTLKIPSIFILTGLKQRWLLCLNCQLQRLCRLARFPRTWNIC